MEDVDPGDLTGPVISFCNGSLPPLRVSDCEPVCLCVIPCSWSGLVCLPVVASISAKSPSSTKPSTDAVRGEGGDPALALLIDPGFFNWGKLIKTISRRPQPPCPRLIPNSFRRKFLEKCWELNELKRFHRLPPSFGNICFRPENS